MEIGNKKIECGDTKEILKELSGNEKPSDEEMKRIQEQLKYISRVKDFITKKN